MPSVKQVSLFPQKNLEEKALKLLQSDGRAFIHSLVSSLSEEGQQWLAERVFGSASKTELEENVEFANRIGASQHDPTERKAIELASLINFFEYRKKLLASAIPATTVAEMLGVSRQTVHDRVKSGCLLGILDSNTLKIPDWQFDPQGPNGVVPGLPEVLAALSCGTLAKISWLSLSNPVFHGLRPIDALKDGQVSQVIHEAQAVGKA